MTPELHNSRFLKAVRREPVDTTPIWLMRQAGRYLPEYMQVRSRVTFLELCTRPDLAAEVTLSAQAVLGVDAAILFADLLPILRPMGLNLEYQPGEGPVIDNPLRTPAAIDAFHEIDDIQEMGFVFETVRRVRDELPADCPLIGFAGAPFTLASYAIEGGGSRNYEHTKSLMYGDTGAWEALMNRLVPTLVKYLTAQAEAGCQLVQIFDSWAGCLSPDDYRRYVLPHSRRLIESLPEGLPVAHFLTGNPALLPLQREAGGDVQGLDWRVDLADGWKTVGHDVAIQGNLDPVSLFTDLATLRERAAAVLDAAGGRPGHIFNLGHGLMPGMDPEKVKALVEMVHEMGVRE
ncbi:MAG: uroporphyrinogen decarboxylase [Planctomycetaceae bacterium]|jgi:uroporphyrinogen decarboxylase|nr:uroporphyrinogen decarboxylase [Planctomycetaceae bacterium]